MCKGDIKEVLINIAWGTVFLLYGLNSFIFMIEYAVPFIRDADWNRFVEMSALALCVQFYVVSMVALGGYIMMGRKDNV